MLATGTDPRKREEEFSSKVWNSSAEGGGAKSRRWRGRALDLAEDKATSSAAVPSSPLAAEPVRSRRKRILALNKKPKNPSPIDAVVFDQTTGTGAAGAKSRD